MKKTVLFPVLIVSILLALLMSCNRPTAGTPTITVIPRDTGQRAFPERWVTVSELVELMQQDNVVVVDFSEQPNQVIPGAIWIARDSLYRDFEGNVFDIEIKEVHEAVLGAHGIDNSTTVITYCDNNSLWGTRIAWNLLAYGHKDVRILEGGTRAWLAAGGTVGNTPAAPRPARTYVGRTNVSNVRADFRDVMNAHLSPDWVILDVRTQGEWDAGRIPSAIPFRYPDDFLDLSTGMHFPRLYYEDLFRDIPRDAKIIVHCSGGTRTSMVYFILIDIMGWPQRVLNYNGSWPNWVWAGGPVER
ncbi:MAG: rhodanese-like domain-containing protein [Treponema sp.]|nr:rhodanese-like domain-containing protein [Treponema sp.]